MNRWLNQFPSTFNNKEVYVYARVTFGSSGAPTLVTSGYQSKGVYSVTRDSQGKFTFVFGTPSPSPAGKDTYVSVLGVAVSYDSTGNSGNAPAAPLYHVSGNSVSTVNVCSIQVTTTNTSGTATDPASGEAAWFQFKLNDSTAP
jgi:hypothetical protein